MIKGTTKIVGILGYPISHSLSPLMHNSAFEYLKLDYWYIPFNVEPTNLGHFLKYFRAIENFVGFNITIPYKEKVMSFLDKIDPLAKKVGAVNTVVKKNGKIIGYNTDTIGFIKPLLEKHIQVRGKNVLLFGAGGAARAISTVLVERGVKSIFITDIIKTKAIKLVKDLRKRTKNINIQYIKKYEEVISDVNLLVNATPVGMKKGDPLIIDPSLLHKNLVVYDIVYNKETDLLKVSKEKGLKTIDGKKMLVYQGGESFKLWTGQRPPLKLMLKNIEDSLKEN